ncbi:MAG: hypothetical protein Q9M29_04310, partial [Mariprofundaceae bacterium]|nr:hypothetical protein [Mariprofundaceae bacterium]
MSFTHSSHLFRLLWVAAVLLLSTVVLPRALGQVPLLRTPVRSEASSAPQDKSDNRERLPAKTGPSLRSTACCSDYWILRSHACPQGASGGCVCCQFEYIFFGSACGGRRIDPQAFRAWLKPGVAVCIVVHGSNFPWQTIVEDSRHMLRWIRGAAPNRSLQIVFFSWPTGRIVPLFAQIQVARLGRRSAYNGIYLAQLISQIPPESPVSLLGHSHGARTVAAALHLLGGGSLRGYRLAGDPAPRRKIRAVLSAAALDHHWLNPGQRYGCALCRADFVVNIRN